MCWSAESWANVVVLKTCCDIMGIKEQNSGVLVKCPVYRTGVAQTVGYSGCGRLNSGANCAQMRIFRS